LTDYGVSLAQVNLVAPFLASPLKSSQLHRQFDLAQYLHTTIYQEDRGRLLWDPSTGVFEGFKPCTAERQAAIDESFGN
jgi:hypothetical protein